MTQNEQTSKLLEEVRELTERLEACEQEKHDLKQKLEKQKLQIKCANIESRQLRTYQEYFVNYNSGKYHLANCEYYNEGGENWASYPVDRAEAEGDGNKPCQICIYPRGWWKTL